jgi:hypothetical protein
VVLSLSVVNASVAVASVAWSVRGVAQPSQFVPAAGNQYQLLVLNTGNATASPGVTLTDRLPSGLAMTGFDSREGGAGAKWACEELGASLVTCTLAEALAAGSYAPSLAIELSVPSESPLPLENSVTVGEGGAVVPASTGESTPVGTGAQTFGITEFSIEAHDANGEAELQAGGHPWQVTASLGFPWRAVAADPDQRYAQVQNVKKIAVELPTGMVGNPLTTEHCTQSELSESACPPGSMVGSLALAAASFEVGEFHSTGESGGVSAIYNMVSEPGYPAEFAVNYAGQSVYLYVSMVHTASGERLRLATVGVPPVIEAGDVVLTLWGEPGAFNGSGSEGALLSDPADCSGAPANARVEAESWGDPGHPVSQEATVLPQLTGCGLLQSAPAFAFTPNVAAESGTSEADEPSGYSADLAAVQSSAFSEPATPELRDATVTLPEGIAISPAAAQGLVACQARGPEGINLGSDEIGPAGQDMGDPEATELGEGHGGPGGNDSPYDDGQYHTAPGHCPDASTLGTVEAFTPLLATRCGGAGQARCEAGESPAPLQGHMFLAVPQCGGHAQASCTEASAADGKLFGLYIEVEGSGVIVKLQGSVAADPVTGQLTASFKDLPQLPFSDLKLHFKGGDRAPLANPQECGSFATSSTLASWSEQTAFNASLPFSVDWNGSGGACPASLPFSPGFSAGTVTAAAGAFSPFTLTLSRHDREQDISALTFTTPPGLLADLSSVAPCEEPQASKGECGPASLLGEATIAAGAGAAPYWVRGGRVYLTGPYDGQPFGLSIAIPGEVGPFNLGAVIIRAQVAVNPTTLALTIATGRGVGGIPIIKDGIPLRLRTINLDIDRAGFFFNPTNCATQSVTATVSGAQGAAVNVASPFTVTGCRHLPFAPKLTALTRANGEFAGHGASLHLAIATAAGSVNLRSLKLDLPQRLPARLGTIQKACREKVFNANPAACPKASMIGFATVATPMLAQPLRGPAILVSRGGKAFPDMVLVLQARGVTVELTGALFVDQHNITSTTFRSIPDVPIRRLDLVLPEGRTSVLAANAGLCTKKPLIISAVINAQDNARVKHTVHVAVEGCKHEHRRHSSYRQARKQRHDALRASL